jgi:hypothetical protein
MHEHWEKRPDEVPWLSTKAEWAVPRGAFAPVADLASNGPLTTMNAAEGTNCQIYRPTTLGAGDSVYLDAGVVHASYNDGDETAQLQVMIGPSLGEGGYGLVDVGRGALGVDPLSVAGASSLLEPVVRVELVVERLDLAVPGGR